MNAYYAPMGMWRRIPLIGFSLAEIRVAGSCHGASTGFIVLCQVESYMKDVGMAGLASAWAMARRRSREYCRKVEAATRCFGV